MKKVKLINAVFEKSRKVTDISHIDAKHMGENVCDIHNLPSIMLHFAKKEKKKQVFVNI